MTTVKVEIPIFMGDSVILELDRCCKNMNMTADWHIITSCSRKLVGYPFIACSFCGKAVYGERREIDVDVLKSMELRWNSVVK